MSAVPTYCPLDSHIEISGPHGTGRQFRVDLVRGDNGRRVSQALRARCASVPKFGDTPELLPTTLLPAVPDTLDAIRADLDALEDPTKTPTVGNLLAALQSVSQVDTASAARTLHIRRQLAQAAEHGAALLAALGLPQLVTPGFVPLDPVAIGEAVEAAVAALDAMDGDPDVEEGGDDEPSLGWIDGRPQHCGDYGDRELDTADHEPSLASPERHPEPPVPGYCAQWGAYVDRSSAGTQLGWAQGARDDRELVTEDGPIDDDERDGEEHDGRESTLGWPEDFTAADTMSGSCFDEREDDAQDLEGESDDDPGAEPWWSFDRSALAEGEAHV